jgi:K+-sensing histidine kinase KdpD
VRDLFCLFPEEDWNGRMSGIDYPHPSADQPRMPGTTPPGLWHAATHYLFGIIGVSLITFAAVRLHIERFPPPASVGPGTIALLYLIVIVFVSVRGGFVPSAAVSLIGSFCLNYFVLPLVPSLKVKNPLDIVATIAFLFTAWVITAMVARFGHGLFCWTRCSNRRRKHLL